MTRLGSSWLRDESPPNLEILTRLRERLAESIDSDTNEEGTPSADWCLASDRYARAFEAFLAEQRERMALRIKAAQQGAELLDDDEYEAGLAELAVESLSILPEEMLRAELARRASQPEPSKETEE